MKTPCSPRHRRHCSRAHAALVCDYRDQRDAREALRESGAPATVDGAAYYQLEDDDFDQLVPRVTFKDWLVAHARPRLEQVA